MIIGRPLQKADFQLVRDEESWGIVLRDAEIRGSFKGFPEKAFHEGLELGCGTGQYSKTLALYCEHLTATEYDRAKLRTPDDANITFRVADAQDLSGFSDSSMDLIFSSNLLEHLPAVDNCLRECARVIRPGGVIIHTVPNNVWKVFNLLLFYPALIKLILRRLVRPRKASVGSEMTLDCNLRPRKTPGFSSSNLVPQVHGISNSHSQEFRNWREKTWLEVFHRNHLQVVRIVRLPFYYGYGYQFRMLLKLGNRIGLSSCTAYVLKVSEDKN